MSALNINILGQTFTLNVPDEKRDEYEQVAIKVDKMIISNAQNLSVRSDLKAAIQTAFVLALENEKLKKSNDVFSSNVDNLLSKFDNVE